MIMNAIETCSCTFETLNIIFLGLFIVNSKLCNVNFLLSRWLTFILPWNKLSNQMEVVHVSLCKYQFKTLSLPNVGRSFTELDPNNILKTYIKDQLRHISHILFCKQLYINTEKTIYNKKVTTIFTSFIGETY